jgi:hypothetical protein
LALLPRLACQAIDHPGDAGGHPGVRFGACFLIFAHDLADQDHPSAGDVHLHSVAGNGQIPVQRCHDREFYALVASTLPIVIVVSSELELRGEVGWVANRNNGLACSFVKIFPSNALQLMSPLSLRLWVFPLLTMQRLTLGSLEAAFEIGTGLCKRNPRSFWEFMVCGNKRPMNAARGMRNGN